MTSNGQNEIWVTAAEDMAIYRQGNWEAARMTPPIAGGGVQFVQAFQDRTAVASKSTVQIVAAGAVESRLGVGRELPGNRIQSMLFDRVGTLWIGTNGGLVRWLVEEAWIAFLLRIHWRRPPS